MGNKTAILELNEVHNSIVLEHSRADGEFRGILSMAPSMSDIGARLVVAETLLPLVSDMLDIIINGLSIGDISRPTVTFTSCPYLPLHQMLVDGDKTDVGSSRYKQMLRKAVVSKTSKGPDAIVSVDYEQVRYSLRVTKLESYQPENLSYPCVKLSYQWVTACYSDEKTIPQYSPFCIQESELVKSLLFRDALADVDRYSIRIENIGDSSSTNVVGKLIAVNLANGNLLFWQQRCVLNGLPAWAKAEVMISGKLVLHLTHSTAGRQLEATDINVGIAMDHVRNADY
jgi:hypothetical protein